MRLPIALILTSLSAMTNAQTFTYTESQAGDTLIPLGYPVPAVIDSITPIDGFRSYSSLHLRHQQLASDSGNIAGQILASSFAGRDIWLYQLSDADALKADGSTEGAVLINGGIHAREWQSPEATTGFMEKLQQAENEAGIEQYVLENLALWLIPVLNVDGLLQTQRFPSQITDSEVTPRDGRMRRKNMRDVDEDIATVADNLNGIDLNRNNPPFWATNPQRSSSDPQSIIYHGSGPASEPETQALQQAASLADAQGLRLYIDVHSFSQIYFTPMTGNADRDDFTGRLAGVMRAANDNKYRYGPFEGGSGIGATDEYFANTFEIPSYTLEIEPLSSASQYGGFGVSHDGFILPASEVSRMRDETFKATLAGLYAVADMPYVSGMHIRDALTGEVVLELAWQSAGAERTLEVVTSSALAAETDYVLQVRFNKPMRWIEQQQLASFSDVLLSPDLSVSLVGEQQGTELSWQIATDSGQWLTDTGFARYRADTFEVGFSLDASFDWGSLEKLSLSVDTTDIAGNTLDAWPATIVAYDRGSWTGYEDESGNVNGRTGGADASLRLIDDGSQRFAQPAPPPPAPAPAPPPANVDSSSGGSATWGLILIVVAGMLCRRVKTRAVN